MLHYLDAMRMRTMLHEITRGPMDINRMMVELTAIWGTKVRGYRLLPHGPQVIVTPDILVEARGFIAGWKRALRSTEYVVTIKSSEDE